MALNAFGWLGMTRRRSAAVALVTAFTLLISQMAWAARVRVFVLAPNPPNSLDWVEEHGSQIPWFSRDFLIPYDVVEQFIRDEIKQAVDGTKSDTVVCTDPCPDVDWKVVVKSSFAFTQKEQPILKAFGNPQQNGVDISLHAQMKINLDVHAEAETWFDSADGDFPIELLIDIDASARLNLWPVLQSQDFKFDLTLNKSNIDLSDIYGEAIEAGAKIGVLIGFTPIGLALGGPGGLGLLLAIIGAEAADVAEQKIKAAADKAFNDLLKKAEQQIKAEVQKRVDPAIQQANNLKDQLLNSKLPEIGKSYQELSEAFGLTLVVQTTTPSGNVNVIVTPRFAAQAGSGNITGKLRVPKDQCIYLKYWILGVIPLGFDPANQDLGAKVGSSCSSVFPVSSLTVSGYLGADPKIVSGSGANPLPTWKGIGNVSLTGILTDSGPVQASGQFGKLESENGYYECGFEISGLPNASIIAITPSNDLAARLTDFYGRPSRYVEVSARGQLVMLNHNWHQIILGLGGLVLGGMGQCSAGSSGTGFQQSWWQELKDSFDPEKCPQCGINFGGQILEISNPAPLMSEPAVKQMFDAAKRGGLKDLSKQLSFGPAK
jgi:hypothetical protein